MTDDVEEVASRSQPEPRIVSFGMDSYFVIVEKTVICQVNSISKALMMWFTCHYVFHLEYSKQAKSVLLFIQEYVFKQSDPRAKNSVTYLSVVNGIQVFID